MNHNLPIRVRSTFSDDPGTIVRSEDDSIERLVVRGISHDKNDVKITLRKVPDKPGIAASLFTALADAHINVDVIVQNTSDADSTDISFTVNRTDRRQASEIVWGIASDLGVDRVDVDDSIAKISIVGVGMRAHPGVAAMMFSALHKAKINIQMITTSEIRITCVVHRDKTADAVNALHDAFELEKIGKLGGSKNKTRTAASKRRQKAK